MKKRTTKSQREAAQREALRQRVSDIYAGAGGREWTEDEFATCDDLTSIIPALREVLGGRHDFPKGYPNAEGAQRCAADPHYKLHLAAIYANAHTLGNFDNPRACADWLYDTHGVRA